VTVKRQSSMLENLAADFTEVDTSFRSVVKSSSRGVLMIDEEMREMSRR